MRAFIVGITGFVGSHLAEYLLEQQVQVTGCSRTAKWKPGAPLALAAEIPVFSWDLRSPFPAAAASQLATAAPDWIFHLGAVSIPRDCGQQQPTADCWATNVEGTQRLCEMALALPNRPRVLLTSSCHVYRPVSVENPYVGEDAPLEPSTPYGLTKLEAERRFQACVQQGLDGVVARAFHHCGPRQSPRMVLPDWVRQFVRDDMSTIQVHSLDAYLDLCDVRDVVRAYVLLAQRAELGATYNVGSGICRRSGDVFERLRAIAGPTRKVLETAPGRRQQPIAVIDRLKRATGWRPQIPLQQTLADTLDYWRQVQPAAE